jgi:hypothetical protein
VVCLYIISLNNPIALSFSGYLFFSRLLVTKHTNINNIHFLIIINALIIRVHFRPASLLIRLLKHLLNKLLALLLARSAKSLEDVVGFRVGTRREEIGCEGCGDPASACDG